MDENELTPEDVMGFAGMFGLAAIAWLTNYAWYTSTGYPMPFCKVQQWTFPIFSQILDGAFALTMVWCLVMAALKRTIPMLQGLGIISLLLMAPGMVQTIYGFGVPCWPHSPTFVEVLNWMRPGTYVMMDAVGG